MRESVKGPLRTAITVVLSIALAIGALQLFYGSAAREDRAITRATFCVLAIPPEARSELHVNQACLISNGLEPFDINGDGHVEK